MYLCSFLFFHLCFFFFFFSSRRRHTRLQGDWSSDVCSSDLTSPRPASNWGFTSATTSAPGASRGGTTGRICRSEMNETRSEERRVGKECRCRWWQAREKKKQKKEQLKVR